MQSNEPTRRTVFGGLLAGLVGCFTAARAAAAPAPPPTAPAPPLPPATAAAPVPASVSADGLTTYITYSACDLPAGMQFNSGSGLISAHLDGNGVVRPGGPGAGEQKG